MLNYKYLFFIILANIAEFTSDASFKFFARTAQPFYLFAGVTANIVIMYLLYLLLKISNLVYMNALWEGWGLIFESLMAFILLGEVLANHYQYFGLFFTILGMILMNIGNIPY